jgi:glucose-1-phosphate cytidylyltransferase
VSASEREQSSRRVGDVPVLILCGGRGTRLRERTESMPKALIEIGGRPIVWHVVRIYAAQGFRRFLLLTGYRGEMLREFTRGEAWPDGVDVSCLDTGLDTPTGGRIKLAGEQLGEHTFCATYSDGVADLDLRGELRFHRDHGELVTMAVVRPWLQFGIAELDGGSRVERFVEKPRAQGWVNGGFFCFEVAALGYLEADSVLEREPLERLAEEGRLHAFRHEGFWDCMDTYKDAVLLEDLWASGQAPWRIW